MKRLLIAAACLAAATAGTQAGETFDAGGVGKGTNKSSVVMVREGHMLMNSISTYTGYEAADAKSPMNGMTGTCRGAIEFKIPSATGQGHCEFTDKSGDKQISTWVATGVAKGGALTGTWTVVGGTGRYQNASGGGTFHSLTDRKAGTFVNTVKGAILIK